MDLRQLKQYCQLGGGSRTRFNQLALRLHGINRLVSDADARHVLKGGAAAAAASTKRKRKAGATTSSSSKKKKRKKKKKRAPAYKRPAWMGDPKNNCIICLGPFTEGQRKRYCTDCHCVNRRHVHESCWHTWLAENGISSDPYEQRRASKKPVCPYCQGVCLVQAVDFEPSAVIDLT